MNSTEPAAVAGPVERGVRRWVPVCLAVLDGATYEATSKVHGVTRERVRQMVGKAVRLAQKNVPDRDWSWLSPIEDLRHRPDVRAAVLALLDEAPNVELSGQRPKRT